MADDTPDKLAERTPFNSPRDPARAPYHLRNGIADRAESDRNEAEHRRRLGMVCGRCNTSHSGNEPCPLTPTSLGVAISSRERFDVWISTLVSPTALSERDLSLCWLAWQAALRS
jgi:hypothetical protein